MTRMLDIVRTLDMLNIKKKFFNKLKNTRYVYEYLQIATKYIY